MDSLPIRLRRTALMLRWPLRRKRSPLRVCCSDARARRRAAPQVPRTTIQQRRKRRRNQPTPLLASVPVVKEDKQSFLFLNHISSLQLLTAGNFLFYLSVGFFFYCNSPRKKYNMVTLTNFTCYDDKLHVLKWQTTRVTMSNVTWSVEKTGTKRRGTRFCTFLPYS